LTDRLNILKLYLEEDPGDPFIRYAIALELMKLGNLQQAFQEFTHLISESPDYLPAYYMAGQTAEALQNREMAIASYRNGMDVARKQNNQHALNELQTALELLDDNGD
jgi:tetratricopeptide (TPR) repeat protein